MKKILFICPYFGTLPKEWFQLILNSCSKNSSIDWLLVTNDKTKYHYPQNVMVKYRTWENFVKFVKGKIYKSLGIHCTLDKPYKLCDYKPIYGIIFDDYLTNYDYWGNTDLTDVIYGNLRKYLTSKILIYDKINFLGHLTLYKNSSKVNKAICSNLPTGLNISDILKSNKNYAFDEVGINGIQQIYNNDNSLTFVRIDNMIADISPMRYSFQLSKYDKNFNQYYEKYKKRIFIWENGKLYGYFLTKNKINVKEYGYIHFQKRLLKNCIKENYNEYLITPKGFLGYMGKIDSKIINKYAPRKLYLPFFKLKLKAAKKRFFDK